MLPIWPLSRADQEPLTQEPLTQEPLTDDELATVYAYPDRLDRPYLRANFISSLDGAASLDGRTSGLGSAADRRVFGLLRELCEVILVGANTVRAEKYGGVREPSRVTGSPPPIAVVTATARLDPNAPLFTNTSVPPLVLTGRRAAPADLARLRDAGADLLIFDDDLLSPGSIVAALRDRGLRRVLCEGGPRLFSQLLAADAVDELCLTISPMLTVGDAGRIASGAPTQPRAMRLASAIADQDMLLLRYLRDW